MDTQMLIGSRFEAGTETAEQVKTIRLSEEEVVLPLAQSNIRESDTIIRARSGEIVVIDGGFTAST